MPPSTENPDVVLIGSGIMSATLAALLRCLDPQLSIQVYEVADELSPESSHGWHNAGTGHAGLCELSYTPDRAADGSVNVSKAIEIFEQFEQSLQFWAAAVERGLLTDPSEFVRSVPHLSFVHGREQVDFLRDRHAALSGHHFFADMEFTTDRALIGDWAPLLTDGRGDVPIAATRMLDGTDVNFGNLARKLLRGLSAQPDFAVSTGQRVTDLQKIGGRWKVTTTDIHRGEVRSVHAKFVFVGAGGGSLPLLQRARLPASHGLGGFPIGGQWLVCTNRAVIDRHQAKVYGQALDAAPTMAVPHLDTRVIDGERHLLFGPFAAWTTKFLHRHGSWTDLPRSIRPHNLATLTNVGLHNLDLVRYLIQQGTQSMEDRMEVLRVFHPAARTEDWKLVDAGIRVQAIKKTDGKAGIVHYGTEVLTDEDHSLAALLGASPGASVSVHIVLDIIRRCFPALVTRDSGLSGLIPTFGVDIKASENAPFFRDIHARAARILQLRS